MKVLMSLITLGPWDVDGPDVAKVELTPEKIAEFRKLAEEVKRLDVYKVQKFDYSCEFFTEVDDGSLGADEKLVPWDNRMDCESVSIKENAILWSGYYKHSGVAWETSLVTLDDLIGNENTIIDVRNT